MVQRCDCGVTTLALTWCPVFLLEVGSLSSLSLLSGISTKVPSFESWESLTSKVSGAFWGVPSTSYFLWLPVYILCAGPHPIPTLVPPDPWIQFPSQVHSYFLFSPKWDWGILTWALQLVEIFEFCGIYLVYSVLFLANIHLLVNTYHVCPIGSELPHSR